MTRADWCLHFNAVPVSRLQDDDDDDLDDLNDLDDDLDDDGDLDDDDDGDAAVTTRRDGAASAAVAAATFNLLNDMSPPPREAHRGPVAD